MPKKTFKSDIERLVYRMEQCNRFYGPKYKFGVTEAKIRFLMLRAEARRLGLNWFEDSEQFVDLKMDELTKANEASVPEAATAPVQEGKSLLEELEGRK